jgi:hypothetical protein
MDGGLIFEREAELAYKHEAEIEKAATWCKSNYPHKFKFLNDIYQLLVYEERQLAHMGMSQSLKSGAVKLQPILAILTPSQALRLLEAHRRSTTNGVGIWQTKRIEEMDRLEADRRRDTIVEDIRDQLRKRKT